MHETRQAAQGSIREIIEDAAPPSHGRGVSQVIRRREESRPVRFRICAKEVARNVESGTRRCIQHRHAPNPKHGGLVSMSQAPFKLSRSQILTLESVHVRLYDARVIVATVNDVWLST